MVRHDDAVDATVAGREDGRMRALIQTVLVAALLLVAGPAPAEDAPKNWYDTAVAAGEIDDRAYRKRIDQILGDVNATREQFAGVGPLKWDAGGSEGHFRHARWLLHHMKEPWNSGGVEDFHDEPPGSELFDLEGRAAAKVSVIAFKYIRRENTFLPSENWLPTVVHRLPWLTRSAQFAYIGYAEGEVPEGAEFAGWKWGVVALSTDADYARSKASDDRANDEPVICPTDGATAVPVELQREIPDIVPESLDMQGDQKRKLGFPITFSFFGGEAILSGADVELVMLEEVADEEEKKPERRRPPGSKRGKKKPKKKKPKKKVKTKTVETITEVFVSTPQERPLRNSGRWNANSVVVFPIEPLAPETRYRATLTARTGNGGEPTPITLTTTFTTGKPAK